MARLREADRRDPSKTSILELARDVRRAQELREAELDRAPNSYEKSLRGSVDHAAEFLKVVQKGDAVYEQAMRRAFERYRSSRVRPGAAPDRGD
jgi:hypothetical protein